MMAGTPKNQKKQAEKNKKKTFSIVGHSVTRPDGWEKATGETKFIADYYPDNGLIAVIKGAEYPHAEILSIDIREALKVPGVYAVMTGKDIPGENQIGVVVPDQPCLADKKVRYPGEPVAVVAAESRKAGKEACRRIKVKYRPLPGVFTAKESFSPQSPLLHEKSNIACHLNIRKGSPQKGWTEADIIIEREYQTHAQEHAYLETMGCIAVPGLDESITLYGSMQCPFYVQKAVAGVLGYHLNQVRVIQTPTGGAFGGKEDVPSEFCAKAALLAWKTRRPVKLVLTREEDIRMTSKRHPFDIKIKLGAKEDGTLTGIEVLALADAGAYTTLSSIVMYRALVHCAGAYVIPNVHADVYAVYTNHVPSGAFRGFGSPQVHYAIESIMDELALELKKDPFSLRLKNCLRLGSRTATNQLLKESVGLEKAVKLAKLKSGWAKKRKEYDAINKAGKSRYWKGIGLAIGFYGNSLGAKGWSLDGAGANVQLLADGTATVSIGGTELGQGATSVSCQIVAETLGLKMADVRFLPTDTGMVPDSGPTVASRTTTISGGAVLDASRKILENIRPIAAQLLQCPPDKVICKEGYASVIGASKKKIPMKEVALASFRANIHLAAQGWFHAPACDFDIETGLGDAYYTYSYMADVAEVEVDKITGQVKVTRVTAVHDIGTVINPELAKAQVQGGVAQGIGYAIYEGYQAFEGNPLTRNFATYILPTAKDVPEIDVYFISEKESHGPFGAKSLGEPPIIPVGGAIANAVAHATGIRIRELPIKAEAIWLEYKKKG
jgi:CO/xanthine dehydrogenase Mo-binding subunit